MFKNDINNILEQLPQINFMSDEDLELFTEDIESLNKEITSLKKDLTDKEENIKQLKSNLSLTENKYLPLRFRILNTSLSFKVAISKVLDDRRSCEKLFLRYSF